MEKSTLLRFIREVNKVSGPTAVPKIGGTGEYRGSPRPRVDMMSWYKSQILDFILFDCFWLCPAASGILVPWPGIKPVPPAAEPVFLTTGPPGKFLDVIILCLILYSSCPWLTPHSFILETLCIKVLLFQSIGCTLLLFHACPTHLHHISLNYVITIKSTTGINKFGNSAQRLFVNIQLSLVGAGVCGYCRKQAISLRHSEVDEFLHVLQKESINNANLLSGGQRRELLYIRQDRLCTLYDQFSRWLRDFQGRFWPPKTFTLYTIRNPTTLA